MVHDWLTGPSLYMRFRVVVRQIESWLLADVERFAGFFSVRISTVPGRPDDLDDARDALLHVVSRSRQPAVRTDMLPRPRSGRRVGPAYTSRLIEFAASTDNGWRPEVAAERSPSLAGCLARVRQLVQVGASK